MRIPPETSKTTVNTNLTRLQSRWWLHRRGQIYRVLLITNSASTDPLRYPETVVYQDVETGRIWSRLLADWDRSMTAIRKDE